MRIYYEKKDHPFYIQRRNKLACDAHLHHHIEIVYMIEGNVQAFVDSNEVTISTGDIFISFPNQIHAYREYDGNNSIILIFSPDQYPEYKHIFASKVPTAPIIKKASRNEKIPMLLEQLFLEENRRGAYQNAIIRGYFLILLGEIFQMTEFENVKTVNIDTLKSVLIYCMQNYTKDIKLSDLERDLHISRYYISHMFSSRLKMGFNAYINSLRISDASRELKNTNKSIAEIAYSAGFNSLRSFNRAFQSLTGITPSQYRKNMGIHINEQGCDPCGVPYC